MYGGVWGAVKRSCYCFCRAQDQASMQLSEMEEEMDQRIHAAERKARDQVGPTQTRRHKHIRLHTTQKDDFLILF